MDIKILPAKLRGAVSAPPSKSDVHRAIICAALSGGVCRIAPVALSEDIKATIGCVRALGAKAEIEDKTLTIDGSSLLKSGKTSLFCGESGSTLRFFVPVAAALGLDCEFTGRGSLLTRPIGLFADILPEAGVECQTSGTLPLKISGRLEGGTFSVPGNISSQFITGLLFALPLLEKDSKIVLTSPLQSEAYVDMTIRTMSEFGVKIEKTDFGYIVRGSQSYQPRDYSTDGDWSQAAFFMVAGAISGDVLVRGVKQNSTQGDKEIASLLRQFGADISFENDGVRVKKSRLSAINIDASQIPDLVPVLAVAASFAEGKTAIRGAQRLRIKESDRLKTSAALLNSLGGRVEEKPDGLVIEGVKALSGGFADGSNDHRIVMSAAIAALGSENAVTVSDRESINKSYPDFFEDYNSIGGKALCQSTEQK